jgi:acyl-homoserine-lactone acylase
MISIRSWTEADMTARWFLAGGLAMLLSGCGDWLDSPVAADIRRTEHGVAHIKASDFRGLGYGLAYAYAQDNVCMLADSIVTVRGERSRFFGPEGVAANEFMQLNNLDSDFFFKGYLDPARLADGYDKAPREVRELLTGYVAGYNRYLRDKPEACGKAAWVRPITVADMHLVLAEKALHATGQVFAKEFVGAGREEGQMPVLSSTGQLPSNFLSQRLHRITDSMGSNALAIGRDLSANGAGILLANPHYPWTTTDRFYQAHLTVPGQYDAMGVVLGGIPLIVIGFNKDVAWSHTVTRAVHFTTFRLKLDPADPTVYLRDGVKVKMHRRDVAVEVRQPDGATTQRKRSFYFSEHGAVIVNPAQGIAWTRDTAIVLADPNRHNTRLLEQWLAIGRSDDVRTLRDKAIGIGGLPWVNTVASDRHGEALYVDASVVPNVPAERFASDCHVLPALLAFDGSRAACDWEAGKPAAPQMLRTDYVQNSNDSYWLTNPRQMLTGQAPLYGPTHVEQSLRTRIGFRQIEDLMLQKRRIDPALVQELVFANRIYAAELAVPGLISMCMNAATPEMAAGCSALAAWDKRADLTSRGAVLFREFWNRATPLPGKWAIPFDPADPVNTPRELNPAAARPLISALGEAVATLRAKGIPLDAPLGEMQADLRNGKRLPVHGGSGNADGSYNAIRMAPALTAQGYTGVEWGTSYVQVVSFDKDGPLAHGMLLYGQSSDSASPLYADQLPTYARKAWPRLPFSDREIRRSAGYTTLRISE